MCPAYGLPQSGMIQHSLREKAEALKTDTLKLGVGCFSPDHNLSTQ
jgi:hypothetical protein